jgi:hypothetical protein
MAGYQDMRKKIAALTIALFLSSQISLFAASDKTPKAKESDSKISLYVAPVQQEYNNRYAAAKEQLDALDRNVIEKAAEKVEKIVEKLSVKVEKLLDRLPARPEKVEAKIEKSVNKAIDRVDKVADKLVKKANKVRPAPSPVPNPEPPPTPPVPGQDFPTVVDLSTGYSMGTVMTLENGDKAVYFNSTGPTSYYDRVLLTYDTLTGALKSAVGSKSFSTLDPPDLTGYTFVSKTTFADGGSMTKYVYQDPVTNKTIVLYYDAQSIFSSADVAVTESIPLNRLTGSPLVV